MSCLFSVSSSPKSALVLSHDVNTELYNFSTLATSCSLSRLICSISSSCWVKKKKNFQETFHKGKKRKEKRKPSFEDQLYFFLKLFLNDQLVSFEDEWKDKDLFEVPLQLYRTKFFFF